MLGFQTASASLRGGGKGSLEATSLTVRNDKAVHEFSCDKAPVWYGAGWIRPVYQRNT